MKKIFELLDAAKEEHEKIQTALDELDEIPHSLLVGWIGAELNLITEIIKKLEEIRDRQELIRGRY
jgi:hypothetical protein